MSTSKHSSHTQSEARATQSERNVVSAGGNSIAGGDSLASVEDLNQIRQAPIPAALTKNPVRGLGAGFTPEVRKELGSPKLAAYFGTRVKLGEMVTAAARYAEMDARRTRLEHTAALAARIGAPDGVMVEEELAKLMKGWADFEKDLPREALALEALRERWLAVHPGSKNRKPKASPSTDTPAKS